MRTAIILISETGVKVARLLSRELAESEIFSLHDLAGCTPIESVSGFTQSHFHQYDALIYIGAMGICVRAIAPCVKDKYTDPAVVCIDSTGSYAVSVLSGHVGGANDLTAQVAAIIGAEPVVTTQSDRTGLWALDTLGKRFGWTCTLPNLNASISLFVSGAPTALLLTVRDKGTDWLEANLPSHVNVFYHWEELNRLLDRFKLLICVSPVVPQEVDIPMICYVPKVIHLGIGLAHQAQPADEIICNIEKHIHEYGLGWESIASISTIDVKRDEPVISMLQEKYPVRFYTAEELAQVDVPNPNPTVQQHVGTSSVSEAAALLTSGNPTLIMTKQKGTNYTVAAAMDRNAERSGHIEIVGAGPGDPDLISVRGRQMLQRADLILYAGSLVPRELTLCHKPGATVRSSADMDLEEQFALMKTFYDAGKFVVRLHTGDPCIYGAIQEQMNYFDRYGMSYHITPGISSFQAAAAALRSQFTIPEKVQSIILTRGEGRTPMPEKEKLHLLARSQSTMCIFLSASIARQVQEELLQAYPPTTPVAVCYHLTWPDERIYRGVLAELADMVEKNRLTLTTMIVVGDAIDNRQGLSRLYASDFKHLFRK